MNSKFQKKVFVIAITIFLVALLPRLFIAFNSKQIPTADAAGYDDYAKNILEGKGLINAKGELTSWREPIYPYFLSCVYYFFGHSYLAVRSIQSVLGAFICVIIFLLAYSRLGIKVGIISALFSTFNPIFMKLPEQLSSENIFTFLFALAILFLMKHIERNGDLKNLIISGFILGLATLTRSVTLCFPLFIVFSMGKAIVTSINVSKKRYLITIFAFIFSFILPILPWTIRNWKVHHRFVPVVSRTGLGLYSSYVPKQGKIFGFNADDETTKKSETISSEVERSDFLVKETIKYIKNNPNKLLRLEILKAIFFWSPFDWDSYGRRVYNFAYGFILPFFILGMFLSFKKFKNLSFLYLPIIYIFLFALLTFGIPRFRLPVEPYIIIISAIGIEKFWHLFSKKIYALLLVSGLFLFNLMVYFNADQTRMVLKSALDKINLW